MDSHLWKKDKDHPTPYLPAFGITQLAALAPLSEPDNHSTAPASGCLLAELLPTGLTQGLTQGLGHEGYKGFHLNLCPQPCKC